MVHGDRVTKTVGRDFLKFYGRLFLGGGRGAIFLKELMGGFHFSSAVDPGGSDRHHFAGSEPRFDFFA
jgi:hypothetical protein